MRALSRGRDVGEAFLVCVGIWRRLCAVMGKGGMGGGVARWDFERGGWDGVLKLGEGGAWRLLLGAQGRRKVWFRGREARELWLEMEIEWVEG